MNTGQAENPSTERWKRARGPGEEEEEEEGRWRRAKIAAICIIYRVPPFGLLAAIYSARKSSETMHRCREREVSLVGTILSLAAFRGAGAKENGPCPSFPPSPAFTFSNIMKSVTCEKFKIQPSFPPLSPPRPLAFSDARLLLYFSLRLFACAREKRGRGQSVENISLLSSMMETIPNFRILLRHTYARIQARTGTGFQSFVSRCTSSGAARSSVYTCGVACDTASCNASPESGLKAVYTHLACASFHSRRRKRRSSEKGGRGERNL